jgi:hypothetical protein
MRYGAIALVACLAGCSLASGDPRECTANSQCGSDDVCAQGGECTAKANVREVTVMWTIAGAAASTATCAAHPSLVLKFEGADFGDRIEFSPVPCVEGLFHITQLPKRYLQVELEPEVGLSSGGNVLPIDVSSKVQFNLE